jgi:hypothetical protein
MQTRAPTFGDAHRYVFRAFTCQFHDIPANSLRVPLVCLIRSDKLQLSRLREALYQSRNSVLGNEVRVRDGAGASYATE